MKICTKCKVTKEIDEFRRNKNKLDGHEYACKECRKLEQRISYKEKNWKEKKKALIEKNPEKYKKYAHDWQQNNKELCRKYGLAKRFKRENGENLFFSAKVRSKKNNIEFSLEKEDITIPEKCPIFGTVLNANTGKGYKYHNTSSRPSLDRMDNSKGYIKGNVWVVSSKANVMKNNASITELKIFCTEILKLIKNGTIHE